MRRALTALVIAAVGALAPIGSDSFTREGSWALVSSAHAVIAVPAHTGLVVDGAGLLAGGEAEKLAASLTAFQRAHGPQIQLLTVPSLEGEAVESFALRAAEAWKLGDQKRDDGVLMVIAARDRAMRIEVGQGLEGQLPDVIAGRIIRDVMTPFFRAERYSEGIFAGLQAVATRIGGPLQDVPVYEQPRTRRAGGGGVSPLARILGIIFIILLLRSVLGRGGGRGAAAGYLLGSLLGGGGRGGGGFGGFGGGGGGGFSGGGASGRW